MAEIPEPSHGARELPELADLLADQFGVLDDVRPTEGHVVIDGEVVVFAFSWPYIPADALVARSEHRGRFVTFRGLLLEEIADYLTEVVEFDLHRDVTSHLSTLGMDPRQAEVSFALGARTDRPGEAAMAVRNWSGQLRRQAREHRRHAKLRRAELQGLRVEFKRDGHRPDR